MLNRRHLRIKVLQILYAFFQSSDQDLRRSEKELSRSIEKMYELYIYYLLTFEEMTVFANQQIEDRSKKLRPSERDLSPNRKFVDNPVFEMLRVNTALRKSSEELKVNWTGAVKHDLMRKLYLEIQKCDIYRDYMDLAAEGFESDRQFAIDLFKSEIANFELIHDFFENESIYWMDDIDLVCSMVIKTLKGIEPKQSVDAPILPLYKDEVDERNFVEILFRDTILNDEANDKMIDSLTKNWELDRIAKMDIILLKMAITELKSFSSIPKKVTLNEYIEISKFYSTPKSQVFINGILDKAIETLEKEGQLKKTGRGLIN